MAEEKGSFVSGLKDEAVEQGTHAVASEIGQGVRSVLEGVVSPEVLRTMSKGGFAKIASNVAAFFIRAFLPDSRNGELLKDAVTEAFNEAFDFGVSAKTRSGGQTHVSDTADFGTRRNIPAPRGFTYAVLGASQEVLGNLAAFIAKVYAKSGESEVERIFFWLCTLSQAELIGFSTLTFEQKMAIWKAQLDPKEQKHWSEMAKSLVENGGQFLDKKIVEFNTVSEESLAETRRLEEHLRRLRNPEALENSPKKRWWQFWKIDIPAEYQIWKF